MSLSISTDGEAMEAKINEEKSGSLKTQDWQRIIDDFLSSGKTQSRYCREHDLKLSSFVYYYSRWKRKSQSESCSFIPVSCPLEENDTPFVLTLENGLRLDIPAQFSQAALKKLLDVLRGLTC